MHLVKKNIFFFILGAMGTIGIFLLVFYLFFQDESKNEQFQVSSVIAEPMSENSLFDVFFVSNSGERKRFGSIRGISTLRYHWNEYRGNHLYVIRNAIHKDPRAPKGGEELWKYSDEKHGTSLYFSPYGIDFRVSDDEAYGAAMPVDSSEIALFNKHGIIKTYSMNTEIPFLSTKSGERIDFLGWYGHELWLKSADRMYLLVALNAETQKFETFDLWGRYVSNPEEFSLNTQKRIIAFSNYPFLSDTASLEEFEKNPETITLTVLDLQSGKVLLERRALGKYFHPTWIDGDTVEIDAGQPFGSEREKIKIPLN